MPSLPALRRADCGHGYLPASAKPSGVDHVRGENIYLCAACRDAVRKRPQITRKA